MTPPKLDFYYFESCPYCKRVMNVIEKNQIQVNWMDTSRSSDNAKKLRTDTGRTTVPCLYIDGKPMFESLDIIKWLESNLQNLTKV